MGRKLPQTQDSHPEQGVEWGRGETAPGTVGAFGVVKRRRGCTGVRWVGPDPAKRAQTAEALGGLPSCLMLRKSSRPRLPPRGGETPRRDRKMVGCMWTQRQEPQVCASSSLPHEDPELLPAERKEAAGTPRCGGLPAPRTSQTQVPHRRYRQPLLPLMRA